MVMRSMRSSAMMAIVSSMAPPTVRAFMRGSLCPGAVSLFPHVANVDARSSSAWAGRGEGPQGQPHTPAPAAWGCPSPRPAPRKRGEGTGPRRPALLDHRLAQSFHGMTDRLGLAPGGGVGVAGYAA